jgi:clan AA aspartic protease
VITGVVELGEGRIQLKVIGPGEQANEVNAVIDTGYTASLTLPPANIAALGLQWQTTGRGILADGSETLFDVYAAQVVWDGKVRRLLVDEADTNPLVGMELLRGYELKMEIRSRGKVTIKRLRAR